MTHPDNQTRDQRANLEFEEERRGNTSLTLGDFILSVEIKERVDTCVRTGRILGIWTAHTDAKGLYDVMTKEIIPGLPSMSNQNARVTKEECLPNYLRGMADYGGRKAIERCDPAIARLQRNLPEEGHAKTHFQPYPQECRPCKGKEICYTSDFIPLTLSITLGPEEEQRSFILQKEDLKDGVTDLIHEVLAERIRQRFHQYSVPQQVGLDWAMHHYRQQKVDFLDPLAHITYETFFKLREIRVRKVLERIPNRP